jgi:hypothetical protein
MSLPVDISIASPDPAAAPTTLTQLIVILRTLITAVVTGTYLPYVQGSATPSVSDQNKVWHRTDSGGRPMGTYVYYSGSWRREYTHRLNEVVMYRGTPSTDFETTGLGIVGGEWDGFAIMDGRNSTEDWSDRFIVASHMTDFSIGYPGGGPPSSNVNGSTTHTGGAKDITLDAANTYRPATAAIKVSKWKADGNTPDAGGGLIGSGSTIDFVPANAGNETPPAIPTLPPYIVTGFVQFTGYA